MFCRAVNISRQAQTFPLHYAQLETLTLWQDWQPDLGVTLKSGAEFHITWNRGGRGQQGCEAVHFSMSTQQACAGSQSSYF